MKEKLTDKRAKEKENGVARRARKCIRPTSATEAGSTVAGLVPKTGPACFAKPAPPGHFVSCVVFLAFQGSCILYLPTLLALMGVDVSHAHRGHLTTPKSLKKRRAAAVAAVLASAAFIERKFSSDFNKLAKNDSKLTGQAWLEELLSGHPKRFYASMGMNKHVFRALLRELIKVGLHDTRHVSSEEQLAIFLFLAVTGVAQRHLEERFQRSPDTISKCVSYNLWSFLKHTD
jgi:hypothetical protein